MSDHAAIVAIAVLLTVPVIFRFIGGLIDEIGWAQSRREQAQFEEWERARMKR